MLSFEDTLRGRKCLVTGHTGFTGGWLSIWLNKIGVQPSGFALAPQTTPNLYEAASVGQLVDDNLIDLRNFEKLSAFVEEKEPEIIFHLAAQPIVSRGFEDPLESFHVNALGTANLLEAARLSKSVKAVVCITTDKVYHEQSWPWAYRESDTLGGKDPYSASKAAAEIITRSYQETLSSRGNGVRIATARGGNIIGGGDWADNRIVPDFVRAHLSGSRLPLRSPGAVRPWQHVLALCHGYLALAAGLIGENGDKLVGAYNFGPSDQRGFTVAELIEALNQNWPEVSTDMEPGWFPEAGFLRVDSSKSHRDLGWVPPLKFEDTARLTAEWYRDYATDSSSARALTEAQINFYRDAIAAAGR